MPDFAIEVENLGKKYRIGNHAPYARFTELLTGLAKTPYNMLRRTLTPSDATPSHANRPTDFWALQDVNFTIGKGEIVGIIGRNGAGKSTLLKLISRITQPTTGRIRYRGRIGSLLEVGTGFHPELSGRDNIFLNGAILGMTRSEIKARFDEIVAFAEVEKFLDTPVKHYSSGMYMRLAFAVAAHLEPEILLIDEVLAVGDAEFQKKCLGKMSQVAKGGRTVLFVSHNMGAIEQFCKSIIHLHAGHLVTFSTDVRQSIQNYMKVSPEGESSRWTNSDHEYDNDFFIPQQIAICDVNGKVIDHPIDNLETAYVQISGRCITPNPALTIGYALYSDNGHLLYWSYQTDTPQQDWPKIEKGECVLRSRIPSRLLNEGNYRVELIGSLYFREWLFQPGHDSPSVFFQIQNGLSDSPLWTIQRPGLLAVVLPWERID